MNVRIKHEISGSECRNYRLLFEGKKMLLKNKAILWFCCIVFVDFKVI